MALRHIRLLPKIFEGPRKLRLLDFMIVSSMYISRAWSRCVEAAHMSSLRSYVNNLSLLAFIVDTN